MVPNQMLVDTFGATERTRPRCGAARIRILLDSAQAISKGLES
jgi:hypothetical protein